MDPICEKKYNFLQKYVPCLANLIKLLANDNEKQGKLAQMQLLYDLLNKPDNSVKIETLEKCEEVLCRVFGNNDDKVPGSELVMPSPLIKAELPDEPGDGLEQTEEKNWENLNGSTEQHSDVEPNSTLKDDSPKENRTEFSPKKVTKNLESEQIDKEKCSEEDIAEEGTQSKSNPAEEERNGIAPEEKFDDSTMQKECEDENETDLSIEVTGNNENDSKKEVIAESKSKLKTEQKIVGEIEDDMKIPEENNDVEMTKQFESKVQDSESDSQQLEHEVNSFETKNKTVLEEERADDKILLMISHTEENKIKDNEDSIQSNHNLGKNEIKKDSCTANSDKIVGENDLVKCSLALKTDQEDKELAQTCYKRSLIISDLDKLEVPLNENISIQNESNSISSCGKTTVETFQNEKLTPLSAEEVLLDVQLNDNVDEVPASETTITEDQGESQNNFHISDKIDEIQKKSEIIEKKPDDGEQEQSEEQKQQNTSEKSEIIQRESDNDADSTQEQTNTIDVIRQSPTEMLRLKIVSAESLASPEKTDTNIKHDEKITDSSKIQTNDTAEEAKTASETDNDPLDPLNHNAKTIQTTENGTTLPKDTHKDEDDDDVLLVENRLSPICIDSDPEDEENLKGNRSLPIIPTKLPPPKQKLLTPKPNVRKSTMGTTVMDTIRHIIKKNQNITPKRKVPIQQKQKIFREAAFVKKDPKALMETIDLLDSDSEDERPNNNGKKPKAKTDDDVIIISSTPSQRKLLSKKLNQTVPAPKQIPRLYSKLVNKSPSKPATAQSNFLNAVNLQPAKSNSSNPATFSARLSNKKVIIPNAFYGNPSYNRKTSLSSISSVSSRVGSGDHEESSTNESAVAPPTRAVGVYSGVSIRHVQDKVLKEWLDGFLTNFASPLQIASHACFVLLQRVLKYRFFQRLKETRIYLNTSAKNCSAESVDVQMLLDLRNVFLENDYLTEAGRRFCRFATNDAFGKPVALTTDSKTGRVTCRTRVASKGDLPTDIAKIPNSSFIRNPKSITPDKLPASTTQTPVAAGKAFVLNSKQFMNSSKTTPLSNTSTPSSVPKRRGKFRKLSDGLVVAEKDEDDNDYTPAHDEIEPEAEIVTERKRSLRTNRTKRKEAGFTYSEDHDDEEFEAIARKIENKKREEQRLAEERELEIEKEQLELQRRTNKKTVAKKTTAKRNGGQFADNPKGPTRKKLRLANTSIVGSEDNDLLTPTWIEADGEDGEVDSLLDFADDPQSPDIEQNSVSESNNAHENTFQNDQTTEEASQDASDVFDTHTDKSLKNIDRQLHLHSKTYDLCVHCQRKVPRIVHHYVNEHRSSEVFPSRLRNRDIRRLLTTSNVGFVHLYKGNQIQYAAHCIFCDKEAKFLLPYWFEHFTMHTGEYSFKCSGCHILKPTRSLLTNHITSNTGCPKNGSAIRLVNFDTKVHQIEAHICSICNYIQIHRKNLLRHLRTQHGMDTISPDQIIKVVLLQISAPSRDQDAVKIEESQLALLQHSDDEDNGINNAPLDENSLMMQHDFTDNDDLSFMICGMLDVQTNLSPTG